MSRLLARPPGGAIGRFGRSAAALAVRAQSDSVRALSLSIIAWAWASAACSGAGSPSGTNGTPQVAPPVAAADLVLHTTLDSPLAVATPRVGSGSTAAISTSPANDFVSARLGAGLRADAVGERIEFRQIDGGVQNVELERGTMEFWYRPNYDHDDDRKYTIVGTGDWGPSTEHSSIHLGKHNDSNQNGIFLIFFDANAVRWEHNVSVRDYGWRAGDWLLMRITWDFAVPAGVPNLHLYVNGRELRLTGDVSRGPQPIGAERADRMIYIGSRDLSGPIIANGVYDEVRIWKRVLPPA
ncbi:MAG: LamG-like jellyroll fold domain-containing protein [Gemmatimonadaceae bacterium]